MPSKAVDLYKQYAKAWSAISDQERRSILDPVLETDIIYRIPRMEGTGHQIVINDINEFQAKFPGGQFALHSVSEHHDVALMEWQLILPDGTPGVRGHDAIRVTPEGKLGQIVTFAPSTLEPQAS
ncbi:hypothetical protein [uncultured Paludibaculum sp.]|uniref:hypothetical protein n=1 Tax=uncultured Paludibaculum sp. TaxID=1765020 RepID=UPI002AAA8390|nr:hypothetical protein [uncultured Paludibaculum sp.]